MHELKRSLENIDKLKQLPGTRPVKQYNHSLRLCVYMYAHKTQPLYTDKSIIKTGASVLPLCLLACM